MDCCCYIFILTYLVVLVQANPTKTNGVLILYRPFDISNDCAQSQTLRYDVSFGNGMSDTLTLVFRKVAELDYQCEVDITASTDEDLIYLLVVVRFPTTLEEACGINHNAFIIKRQHDCYYLCDQRFDRTMNNYFLKAAVGRFRFGFLSNSSVNAVRNADIYQVTVTAARLIPANGTCAPRNETDCVFQHRKYCFTSGAVCDGIKNCGVSDWFDERKSKCGMPIERLSATAAIAVVAALFLALLACGHLITSCLPQSGDSFFIFNANEDNRLCIDAVQRPCRHRTGELEDAWRNSPPPKSSGSSSESEVPLLADEERQNDVDMQILRPLPDPALDLSEAPTPLRRPTTMRSMTARLLRSVTGRLAATASAPAAERSRRNSIQLL